MEITYYGGNCLWIETKELKVLFDPFIENYGLKLPKKQPDVVLYSDQQADRPQLSEEVVVIDMPGESEIKGVTIQGVPVRLHTQEKDEATQGVAYMVNHQDLNVLLLGNLAADFSEEQLEQLGEIHITSVPVGGHGLTLDKTAASNLLAKLDAAIVLPTHYADKGVKYPMPQDELKSFLSEIGAEESEHEDKLKVKFSTLPEEPAVIVLNRQN